MSSTRQMKQQAGNPRFEAILVSQSSYSRLADMVMLLRSRSQTLRTVERLSGAHFLVTSESSLAVRVYFSSDLRRLEQTHFKRGDATRNLSRWHGMNLSQEDDLDGIRAFQDSFMFVVIFLVLPMEEHMMQLNEPESVFHRMQRLVTPRHDQDAEVKNARVFLIPDTQAAIEVLQSVADSIHPLKRKLKAEYYCKQRGVFFVPDEKGSIPETNLAANQAASAFSAWAEEFELPPGENLVLTSLLGNLEAVVTADAGTLDKLPLDSRSKSMLHLFFGSRGSWRRDTRKKPEALEEDFALDFRGVSTIDNDSIPGTMKMQESVSTIGSGSPTHMQALTSGRLSPSHSLTADNPSKHMTAVDEPPIYLDRGTANQFFEPIELEMDGNAMGPVAMNWDVPGPFGITLSQVQVHYGSSLQMIPQQNPFASRHPLHGRNQNFHFLG